LKCDEGVATLNALEVRWKKEPASILSGNRAFNFELFRNAFLYLVGIYKSPLFMNKALFYVDFLNFRNHKKSLTGMRYVRLEYGPCPDQYQALVAKLIEDGNVKKRGHNLQKLKEANLDLFDDDEKATLSAILDIGKSESAKYLYDLSHDENAFTKTAPFIEVISYKYAKDLLIKE